MELKLYNTLTRTREPFRPLDPANVRMYVCGPTVYDFAHIGNARPVIVFDVLYRLLRHLYGAGHVKYVRNITDVDDKINARAAEEYPGLPLNDAIRRVTEKTEAQFHEDVAALGCLKPDVEPRATEYVRRTDGKLDMVTLIQKLIDNGNAYEKEGHVLFRVGSMADYGKLSGRSLDEMIAGARVEIAPFKENPMDFVLWKPSSESEPGWESPWGRGRPGWHIECSAMSAALLGKEFDIHGGGIDLVFPHHENELAQTRCAFHSDRMAQVWMHNGFLQVEGAKMSKSLGNFVTIRELLEKWTGGVVRFTMLQTHFNQPIDWTVEKLERSRTEVGNWVALYSGSEAHNDYQYRKYRRIPAKPSADLVEALSDNLNTPKAIAVLREQFSSRNPMDGLGKEFFQNCEFLGLVDPEKIGSLEAERVSGSVNAKLLFDSFPAVFRLRAGYANSLPDVVQRATDELRALGVSPRDLRDGFFELQPLTKNAEIDTKKIEELLAARIAARKIKNFQESDRIRDELAAMGVVLKDNKDGTTTWEVAR